MSEREATVDEQHDGESCPSIDQNHQYQQRGTSNRSIVDGNTTNLVSESNVAGSDEQIRNITRSAQSSQVDDATTIPSRNHSDGESRATNTSDKDEDLEQKRKASRESSKRSQERKLKRIEYLTSEQQRLKASNKRLREDNENLRNAIQLLKAGTQLNNTSPNSQLIAGATNTLFELQRLTSNHTLSTRPSQPILWQQRQTDHFTSVRQNLLAPLGEGALLAQLAALMAQSETSPSITNNGRDLNILPMIPMAPNVQQNQDASLAQQNLLFPGALNMLQLEAQLRLNGLWTAPTASVTTNISHSFLPQLSTLPVATQVALLNTISQPNQARQASHEQSQQNITSSTLDARTSSTEQDDSPDKTP